MTFFLDRVKSGPFSDERPTKDDMAAAWSSKECCICNPKTRESLQSNDDGCCCRSRYLKCLPGGVSSETVHGGSFSTSKMHTGSEDVSHESYVDQSNTEDHRPLFVVNCCVEGESEEKLRRLDAGTHADPICLDEDIDTASDVESIPESLHAFAVKQMKMEHEIAEESRVCPSPSGSVVPPRLLSGDEMGRIQALEHLSHDLHVELHRVRDLFSCLSTEFNIVKKIMNKRGSRRGKARMATIEKLSHDVWTRGIWSDKK